MEMAVSNPYGELKNPTNGSGLVEVEAQRAIAEVQAAMIIARKFPRNPIEVMDRILNACTRVGLAESAMYSYNRGGSDVTGPSIRLAEVIAQEWGNIQFGIRELDQTNGESTVEAYAWDIQNNVRQIKIFKVKHMRNTKKGSYKLEDSRDIYELVANNGARRLRACILGIIPGDVVEAATKQCELTLTTKMQITPEVISRMISKFSEYGITKDQIEKRIQRRIDSITPALMVQLGKISNSLKDGMSVASDWFEPIVSPTPDSGSKTETLKDKLRNNTPETVAQSPTEKAPDPSLSNLPLGMTKSLKDLWTSTLRMFPSEKHGEMGTALKEKFDIKDFEDIKDAEKYDAIISEIESIRKKSK